MNKQELIKGTIFKFSNEKYQTARSNDDIRIATVFYQDEKQHWATGFKIEFNGELIHSSKTYNSLVNRLITLTKKWDLNPCHEHAKDLWNKLGDIPINGNEEIEEPFLHFTEGTDRFNIWHWFENTFNLSIAEDLMHLC